MTSELELCSCGRPLHYTDPGIEHYVRAEIARLGPNIPVRLLSGGGGFNVPRHYIALHGLKAWELGKLAKRYHWEAI